MKVTCPCCKGRRQLVIHDENGRRLQEAECCHCSSTGEIEAEQFGRGRNVSKITAEIAQNVRECLDSGMRGLDIAERYGISLTSVYKIGSGHTWRERP